MADVAGVSRSAAAQWLGQGSKIIHSIGKMEAAENLERETGFNALWIAKGVGPKFVEKRQVSRHEWPFQGIEESKLRSLCHDDASRLEGAMLLAAAQLGIDIKKFD